MRQIHARLVSLLVLGILSLLVLILVGFALLNPNLTTRVFAQADSFSGALNSCDPTYNRLFNVGVISVTGTAVFYEYQSFTVSASGVYTLTMSAATIPDGHASIYQNAFNPATPLVNVLAVDDDSGPGVNPAFININLLQGVTYILVTSSLTNGQTGTYTWTLSGAGTFTLGDNNITLTCPTLTPTNTFTPTITPAPPVSVSGQLDTCDPTYNRLFNTTVISLVGSAVFYEIQIFTVTVSGAYTVSMDASTIADAHASIYQESFNPATPLINVVAVDDDSGPGVNPAFNGINLLGGGIYFLVTSTLNNGQTGTYTWTMSGVGEVIVGSSTITLGCPVPTNTPTETSTPTPTETPTPTPTVTPTETPSETPSPTPTGTLTETPSATATPTPTDTAESTATPTATFTPSPTLDPSITFTATFTFTATATVDPLATATPTATASATIGATLTPTLPPPPACPYPLVTGAVQGRMISSTIALWEPNAGSTTDVIIPIGSSWWIIDVAPGFYKLWIACEAQPVWVSAFLMTPNYDAVWQGQPLPGQ